MRVSIFVLVSMLGLQGCVTPANVTFEQDIIRPAVTKSSGQPNDKKDEEMLEGATVPELISAESARDSEVPRSLTRNLVFNVDQDDIVGRISGEAIEANFRNIPLAEFIQEVYGRLLGLSYVLDPSLTNAPDLVTLSLSKAISPADLYRTSRNVLAEYGVAIVESDELLRFRRDNEAASDVPLLVTGEALPEVPATKRTVFSFVTLEVLRNAQVRTWLQQLYNGTSLDVREDPERNAIILSGPLSLVKQAAETTKLLDQPLMKGKFSKTFMPLYMDVQTLSDDLIKILQAEGYAVASNPPFGSLMVFPLKSQEKIVIFAATRETLDHVVEWAYALDEGEEVKVVDGFFSYEALNVTAEHIVDLVSELKGNTGSSSFRNIQSEGRSTEGRSSNVVASGSSSVKFNDGTLVADKSRNVIIFQGSGKDWREFLSLVKEIDKPVPMVVIDVLLAEITLSGNDESGLAFVFSGRGPENTDLTGSTIGGLGVGSSGLSLTFDSAGQTKAIVNAFYSDDRAAIRSSPKLLVKSGEVASIDVGNEIPIITSNSQSVETPGAPVIQTIQYRSTGVKLNIEPIVQAGGMVDLKVSQELSEQATSSASSVSGSPTILQRRVETSLHLRDGGSVLLGGLISSSNSTGSQGIPGLGRVPVLGRLFRTDLESDVQTELLMLVSVYVIKSHQEATSITELLREKLEGP